MTLTDITKYDGFVQKAAESSNAHDDIQSFSSQFKALGSTETVDARDNTGTTYTATSPGVPIYWLGGAKVADDYSDFYDGSWDSITPTDESGTAIANPANVKVFTGSLNDGTKFSRNARYLGTTGPNVRYGSPGVRRKGLDSDVEAKTERLPMYGLSGVFTVKAASPPELTTATVNGGSLVLTYDNLLATDSVPAAGDFAVTVGGNSRTVSEVAISGSKVTLGLDPAVVAFEVVTITYTPGTNPIKNENANAVALTNQSVTNTTLPMLSIGHASGSEGDPIKFTVTLSPASTETVTVDYVTSDSTANSGADYTEKRATLTFEPGDTSKTITVQSVEDTLREGSETLVLSLRMAINAAIERKRAVGTILDDDEAVEIVPVEWGLIPSGLTVGDSFRLLFVSSTRRDSETADIGLYNTFIREIAATGHEDIQEFANQFSALVSTPGVDAISHTATAFTSEDPGVPVYWLAGAKVADDYSDFYDGSWDSNVPTDESGTAIAGSTQVFTGSNSNGSRFNMRHLGTDGSTVRIGKPGTAGAELDGGQDREKTQRHSVYGLSDVFTIVAVVAPLLTTAAVDGATLTLTYRETLDSRSVPAATDFSVRVGTEPRKVWNVLVNGTAVTLTLESAVRRGEVVTLSYQPGTSGIRSKSHPLAFPASELVNESVTNITPDAPTPGTDRAVLFALFGATGGMNWRNSRNWRSNMPLATWRGVKADDQGYVVELDLGRNGLRGVIPADVMQLTRLRKLNITFNETCAPADPVFSDWLSGIAFDGAYCPTEESQIDIAVFYTPAAERSRGGTRFIETYIDSLIAEANSIFLRNGVGIKLVPVLVQVMQYSGDGPGRRMSSHLTRLRTKGDGFMDDVFLKRDLVGADIVHLITVGEDQFSRGVATLPFRISVTSSHLAFSVTSSNSGASLFAHEIGHVLGLRHDRHELCGSTSCEPRTGSAYPYSFGYVNQGAFNPGAPTSTHWKTIMAYSTQCEDSGLTCPRIPWFSNPKVTYAGDLRGVAGEERVQGAHGPSDAVRALNNTRETVSRYRSAGGRKPVDYSWNLNPAGLGAGDSFRLLFVSSGARNALDSDISEYDGFIHSQLLSGHPGIREHAGYFKALGSTSAVDARDHTETVSTADILGVPIYWLGGGKVADNYGDFYTETWDSIAPTDESGTALASPADVRVFTGSFSSGIKYSNNSRFLGTTEAKVRYGSPGVAGKGLSSGQADKTENLSIYGLSGVFVIKQGDTSSPATNLTISVSRGEVREDAGAKRVRVTVTLERRNPRHVDFELQVRNGTARSPEDFGASPRRMVMRIPAGSREATGSFTLTPVQEREGPPECDETVIVTAKLLTGQPAAFMVTPATVTLKDPGSNSLQCMEPVQRPTISVIPDSPPNDLPEIKTPDADRTQVPPTPAKIAIWTDQLGYQLGQPLRLYRSLDPMEDDNNYTFFYFLENIESGKRSHFAPGIGSTELEDRAVDQFGMSRGAFQSQRIQHAEKELIWAGALQIAGQYQFVVEIRTSDALQVVKTVHAKFVVSDRPPVRYSGPTVDIGTDETWSADTIYELRQPVRVRAGATLTIQAGTLIKALGPGTVIIIERGGRIEAEGTRRAPVVMTCDAPVGQRSPGCWGGLALRGSAPTRDPASSMANLPEDERDLFGGDDPADSSGSLRFVRVEFAGGSISSRGPRAAIAFLGVGSQTVIDHVQAHASLGDGIEIRGGAARCLHCVSSGARDDGLEWSHAWLGTAQHVFLQQSLNGNRGIEATGLGTDLPDSQGPTLYNVTLVGGAAIGPSSSSAEGIALRAGATITMRNAVLIGHGRIAIGATHDTVRYFVDGRSSFQNAIVHGNGGLYGVAQVGETVSRYAQFIDADPQLRNVRYEANPDPRPMPGSVALEPDAAAVPPSDGAVAAGSQFLGAFGESNWLEEWTFFGPDSDYLIEDSRQ